MQTGGEKRTPHIRFGHTCCGSWSMQTRPTLSLALLFVSRVSVAEEPDKASAATPQASVPLDPNRSPTRGQAIFVEGILGAMTPIGLAGVELRYRMATAIEVHGGVGSGNKSVQVDAGVRARIPVQQRGAMLFGLGASTGAFATGPTSSSSSYFIPRAYSLNAEFGLETMSDHVGMRFFCGVSGLLNPGSAIPDKYYSSYRIRTGAPDPSAPLSTLFTPYLGIAVFFGGGVR